VKTDCVREPDIVEALAASRWPDACNDELRGHVSQCSSCADLVDVVLALVDEHHVATRSAPIPSSAIVWWRAQMRARREATQAVNRPITVVHGIALMASLALVVALAGTALAFFRGSVPRFAGLLESLPVAGLLETIKGFAPSVPTATLHTPLGLVLVAIVAVSIVAAPLAVYFAVSDK
jgi:hypothetical protein